MAARRKGSSKKVAVPLPDKEVLSLLLVKDQLARRSLWKSVSAVDRALVVLGWELADVTK
jgi:hypothetical protein